MLSLAADWTPAFSWAMDLLKFGITFGVSAFVGARWIHRANVRFRMKADAVRELQAAAVQYEGAAEAAYVDLYQWDSGVKTEAMKRYEGVAQAGFQIAAEGIVTEFGLAEEVNELHEAHAERHRVYDDILDRQLDARLRNKLLDAQQMWAAADEGRRKFDELLEEARRIRRTILAATKRRVS